MREEWASKRRWRELHRLESSTREATTKLLIVWSRELNSLVVQMRTERLGLCEYLIQSSTIMSQGKIEDANVCKAIRRPNNFTWIVDYLLASDKARRARKKWKKSGQRAHSHGWSLCHQFLPIAPRILLSWHCWMVFIAVENLLEMHPLAPFNE